jgi:endonuclease YncB( thermonuclease family)
MPAATLLCLVTSVLDGDSLVVHCPANAGPARVVVRLAGIDAPEYRQPYGKQALQALQALAMGQTVRLHCHKTDRYQRKVCTAEIAMAWRSQGSRGLDLGHALLTRGMAWWHQPFAHEQTPGLRMRYEAAEQEARRNKAGLWASPQPQSPWQWRAMHGARR